MWASTGSKVGDSDCRTEMMRPIWLDSGRVLGGERIGQVAPSDVALAPPGRPVAGRSPAPSMVV